MFFTAMRQLDLLLRWRALLRCRLVVSFHVPADRVSQRFEVIHAGLGKKIDAAIVLARNEITRFEKWIGADKVVWVPHGIDTDRFRPGNRKPRDHRIRLLFVGDHMRADWNVIHRVAQNLSSKQGTTIPRGKRRRKDIFYLSFSIRNLTNKIETLQPGPRFTQY
jgi:glycosyltransferase involved in cell wall biosynthesis